MIRPHLLTLLLLTLASPVAAQEIPDQIPQGAVLPQNLNALGDLMADRVGELIREEAEPGPATGPQGRQLDLFSGAADEDPNLSEIRRIAKELETQRSVILKLAGLQSDLIEFGVNDPHAAYRSRIPVRVCELAIAPEFCRNLNASFQ
jgi:hypothetical protein